MNEYGFIFRDIAMVFTGAFAGALLFRRLGQPLILGYVLAGLVISPLTPGPRIHDVHAFEAIAEAGVILLMFTIGIEFSVSELLRLKWIALLGAPLGILLSIALGVGTAKLSGWSISQGFALGCIICVASTMVLMRQLIDRSELSSQAGRVMIALTLVEDLAVVILTTMLAAAKSSSGIDYGQIAWRIGRSLFLLIPVVYAAWKLVPRLLARVESIGNDEISLLFALATCLAVAAICEWLGVSLALGAFIGGLLIGSSAYGHKLSAQIHPLRDAFVAIFFVTIGILIDPRTWLANWRTLVILIGLILMGKFVVWFGIVLLFGYGTQTALRTGIGLTQIGEFSFILARVALHSNLISSGTYNAVLAASLLTILANAAAFKLLPLASSTSVQQKLPA